MMSNDHLPKKDSDFNNWFKNLCQYVTLKTSGATPEWTHIPQAEVTLLNNAYSAWYTVYVIVLKPHIPADTLAKDEARDDAEGVIRPFIGQWLMWKQVSDVEREEMGIHNTPPRRGHTAKSPCAWEGIAGHSGKRTTEKAAGGSGGKP
jgi:hypothetical protein